VIALVLGYVVVQYSGMWERDEQPTTTREPRPAEPPIEVAIDAGAPEVAEPEPPPEPEPIVPPPPAVDVEALTTQLDAAYRTQEWSEVDAIAQRILSADPRNFDATFTLGRAFARRRDREQALSWLEQARAIDPTSPAVVFAMGRVYAYHGEIQRGIGMWRDCLELSPGYAPCAQELERRVQPDSPPETSTEPPEGEP
jgi:hypothetical protein